MGQYLLSTNAANWSTCSPESRITGTSCAPTSRRPGQLARNAAWGRTVAAPFDLPRRPAYVSSLSRLRAFAASTGLPFWSYGFSACCMAYAASRSRPARRSTSARTIRASPCLWGA
jgi:hypothetical protein